MATLKEHIAEVEAFVDSKCAHFTLKQEAQYYHELGELFLDHYDLLARLLLERGSVR